MDAIERAINECSKSGGADAHEIETETGTKTPRAVSAGSEGDVEDAAVDVRAKEGVGDIEHRTARISRTERIPRRTTGVLIHCDMGHNRSPTLVLLTLLRRGLTLREAYRTVLRERASIGEYV